MDGTAYLMPRADTSITMDVANETKQNRPIYTECTTPPMNRICCLNLEFRLGPKFMTRHVTLSREEGEKVFKRLAFKEYHCEDAEDDA
ncbi:hypothetical protein EC957_001116 [Mortierella hygrophila]|uniref:Uncharacterized protein n=1 Tax=Mortierella hygrophila TaxID=979708 RepID=A0A9P6FGC2_9FUNG|nr:hypothetical protein EC957_001116 [Mortierella hygrophila]